MLCIALVLALAGGGAAAETGPIIQPNGPGFVLVLPASMADSLGAALPGFVPWSLGNYMGDVRQSYTFTSRQAPWAVVGDFNGDGFSDAVVAGHTDTLCATVCLWGGPVRPATQVIASRVCAPGRDSLDRVLMYVAPGLQGTNFSDDTLFIYTDAFFDYIYEKAGGIWYWKRGEFHTFISAD
jgi:hypothetical protein